MFKKLCLTFGCLSTMLLAGCLSTATQTPINEWSGRYSLIAQNNQHKENVTGRFVLIHTQQGQQILDLKTAIGNTLARIEYGNDLVRVQAVGMEEVVGKDPEHLMNSLLGFHVPLNGLLFWIDGSTLPSEKAVTQPTQPPYESIDQLGWTISYRQYDQAGWPRRIVFEREQTMTSPALKITLIILERRHGTP